MDLAGDQAIDEPSAGSLTAGDSFNAGFSLGGNVTAGEAILRVSPKVVASRQALERQSTTPL